MNHSSWVLDANMNAPSTAVGMIVFRPPIFLFAFCLLAVSSLHLAGQTHPSQSSRDSAIESHFEAAGIAQRNQDYATAEREYQAVLAVAPDFAEARMNLGLIYQLQNRLPEAVSEFRQALKLKPQLAGANFFLGVDYCKEGEGAKALPYLKTALRENPQQADIRLWLATAQEMSGQLHSEVATLLEALQLHPTDADLLYVLGNAYERLGKQEVARLEKIAPGSARSEQLLAESYASSSEWPSAVIHFQNALQSSPNHAGLHAELGEVLLRAGKMKPAIREFDAELTRDPDNLRALVRRGEANLIQQDITAALHDWDKATAIDLDGTERILGLREAGFGDAALEQLPADTRTNIQQLTEPAAGFQLPCDASGRRFSR